jgi:hypothetical protein
MVFSLFFHGIINLKASHDVNKAIAEATANGIKLKFQEMIPPPVPNNKNAALLYKQAFNLEKKLNVRYLQEWKYMPYDSLIPLKKITAKQKKTILKVMKDPEFVQFYNLIKDAEKLPYCRFDIYYKNILLSSPFNHLTEMREIARLIAARTYLLTWEDNYRQAFESVKEGLLLGNSLSNEPILISQMVRVAIDEIGIESAKRFINNPHVSLSINDYKNLMSIINKKNTFFLGNALNGEIVFFGKYILNFKSQLDRSYSLLKSHPFKSYLYIIGTKIFLKLTRPIFKEDYVFYLRTMSKLIVYSNKPYFLIKNNIDNLSKHINHLKNNKIQSIKYIFTIMTFPAYKETFNLQAVYTADCDILKIILGLRIYKQKFGYYPDNLNLLSPGIITKLPVDPFTGKNFIYRKKGSGFIIYSAGLNFNSKNIDSELSYDSSH